MRTSVAVPAAGFPAFSWNEWILVITDLDFWERYFITGEPGALDGRDDKAISVSPSLAVQRPVSCSVSPLYTQN